MEWSDEGVVLGVRRQGENNTVLELFTRARGRHLGLVRGGRGRRLRPVLQTGNLIAATWRARLSEHLGTFSVEALEMNAARFMDDAFKLAGLTTLASHCHLLPERESHEQLYDAFTVVLAQLGDDAVWPALLIRWELGLLKELGFGLDLSACAATGTQDRLIYVSPKSGKAVSAEAGEPYRDKLLRLPEFMGGNAELELELDLEPGTLLDGFRLTSFFLHKHIYGPRRCKPPEIRESIIRRLEANA